MADDGVGLLVIVGEIKLAVVESVSAVKAILEEDVSFDMLVGTGVGEIKLPVVASILKAILEEDGGDSLVGRMIVDVSDV